VKEEHLDGKSYQFLTVSSDGVVMVWDIRYEKIAIDELRHIGRSKHVPTEKIQGKDGSVMKPLWAPIYKAPLKRIEGIGEMSLAKVACSGHLKSSIAMGTALPGDYRSHVMISTEEGDVCFTDICATKAQAKETNDDDEGGGGGGEGDEGRDYVKWMASDHPRPATGFQQSPFFSDILLSIGDWSFNIWRIGDSKPVFTSSLSHTYITGGCWSPSRPAVIFLSCSDGHILVWDFTDTSFKHSIELHATHAKITSMEFLNTNTNAKVILIIIIILILIY
jgi:WD40 repeat protein